MNVRLTSGFALTFVLGLIAPTAVAAQDAGDDSHPGSAIYRQYCAACHAGGDIRAPDFGSLQLMTEDQVVHALTEGIMAPQGDMMSAEERLQVARYLAGGEEEAEYEAWITDMMCPVGSRQVDGREAVVMGRLGVDVNASRNLTAEAAGLTRSDLENLELAWAVAFPGTTGLRAAPVILESTIYYTAGPTSTLLAMDAEAGCVKWAYESEVPLRSSIALGEPDGRRVLYFGDSRAQVHAVDAETGELLWVENAQADPGIGNITGSVVAFEDKVIVPISASGVAQAINPNFECCVGRGAVTVLDARTGERVWVYYTMEEAEYTGEVNSVGTRLRGPSGAPIWSTPSVDPDRRLVFATTGQNTSLPATRTSNAVIALDLDTGEEVWTFQGVPDDVWNMACSTSGGQDGPNCPDPDHSILKDWDFGGSAIPVVLDDGRELLLAGQKSGHLWALRPSTGQVEWAQRVGDGSPLGGNHWGIAVDGERVFLPINDPYFPGLEDYVPVPGMYAFDIATGTPLWEHRLTADCEGDRRERVPQCNARYGLSATPIVVDGAVISAGIDGRIHIFDGETGRVLFEYDSARPYTGVNGVEGHGGAVDSHSIAAGAGMVFIGSGYGSFSQPPGNVLLAFRPASE